MVGNVLVNRARVLDTSVSVRVDSVQLVVVESAEASTDASDVVGVHVSATTPSIVEQVVSMGTGVNHSSVHVEVDVVSVPSMVVVSGDPESRLESADVLVASDETNPELGL